MNTQQKGLLLTFIGALVLTFDTPTLRLLDGPQWTVLFWRMVLLSAALLCFWLLMRFLRRPVAPLVNGKSGAMVSVLYSIGNITFIAAVYNTNVASVVFILALTPMLAAAFSFLWFGERIGKDTAFALILALAGVAFIVGDGLQLGRFTGDAFAAITATTLAIALTLTRKTGRDMSMSPILASVFTASVAWYFSADLFAGLQNWPWLLVNGLLVMPLSYGLLALGPKYIPATEVALFLLLETILAPVWVWLAVGEQVSKATLIGGAVILTTLFVHSLYRLHANNNKQSAADGKNIR